MHLTTALPFVIALTLTPLAAQDQPLLPLVGQLREQLPPSAQTASGRELSRLVQFDPARITWKDDRLHWAPFQTRRLNPQERGQALRLLETHLRGLLETAARNPRTRLARAEIDRLMEECSLEIPNQLAFRDVDNELIRGAVNQMLQPEAAPSPAAETVRRQVSRLIEIQDVYLQRQPPRQLTVNLGTRAPEPFDEQQVPRLITESTALFEREQESLKTLVREALTARLMPRLNAPLLTPADCDSVEINIQFSSERISARLRELQEDRKIRELVKQYQALLANLLASQGNAAKTARARQALTQFGKELEPNADDAWEQASFKNRTKGALALEFQQAAVKSARNALALPLIRGEFRRMAAEPLWADFDNAVNQLIQTEVGSEQEQQAIASLEKYITDILGYRTHDYFTPTSAAPGLARLSLSSSTGSASRTLTRLVPGELSGELAPGLSYVPEALEYGEYSLDEVKLVTDAGAFVGAVVGGLSFSPDGRFLAASGDVVRIWDLQTGQIVQTLRGQIERGGGAPSDIAWTPDGKYLIVSVSTFKESLRVYDTADFSVIDQVLEGHDGGVNQVAISSDGNWLVTAGADGKLGLWNWPERRLLHFASLPDPVDHLSFPFADARALVIDVKGSYFLLDLAAGGKLQGRDNRLEATFTSGRAWPNGGKLHPFALSWGRGGQAFAGGGLGRVSGSTRYFCVYRAAGPTGPQQAFPLSYYCTACAISQDGTRLAAADAQGFISVWNTRANTEEREHYFRPAVKGVYAVEFDRAGDKLLFSRQPLPASGWNWHHYALPDTSFDLLSQSIQSITPREPAPPQLSQQGYTLTHALENDTDFFQVERGGRRLGRFPYHGATRTRPHAFLMLRPNPSGLTNSFVIAGEGGAITLYDADTLLPRRVFAGHQDRVWSVAQSPDGKLLVSAGGDGVIRIHALSVLADWGDLAARADGNGRIYHVAPGTPTERAGIRAGDQILALARQGELQVAPPELIVPGQNLDAPPCGEGEIGERLRGNFYTLGDLATLAIQGDWPFKAGDLASVALERDGQELIVEVELSPSADVADPLLSLHVSPDGSDWTLWSPEGYFASSLNGDHFHGWHVNQGRTKPARFLPAERYQATYYNPELIALALKLGDMQAARQQLGIVTPPPPEHEPPVITILSPSAGTRTGSGEIIIEADIISRNEQELEEVIVSVNGVAHRAGAGEIQPVTNASTHAGVLFPDQPEAGGVVTPAPVEMPPATRWTLQKSISLQPGVNEIEVFASTRIGKSLPTRVQVERRSSNPQKPKLVLLAVGISRYQEQSLGLKFAHRDATELARVWESLDGNAFQVTAKTLTDEAATSEAMLDALNELEQLELGSQDLVVIFVSAQGLIEARTGEPFIAAHDHVLNNFRKGVVPFRDLTLTLERLACRRLLILDTVRSSPGKALKDPFRKLKEASIVLAASAFNQTSHEAQPLGHGVFTHALLASLRAAPPGGSAQLTLLQLGEQVQRQVSQWAQENGQSQTPSISPTDQAGGIQLRE